MTGDSCYKLTADVQPSMSLTDNWQLATGN